VELQVCTFLSRISYQTNDREYQDSACSFDTDTYSLDSDSYQKMVLRMPLNLRSSNYQFLHVLQALA